MIRSSWALRSAALRGGRNNQGNVYGEYLTNAAFLLPISVTISEKNWAKPAFIDSVMMTSSTQLLNG